MPFYNYGAKNGMASIIQAVKFLCRIYVKYAVQLIAYIDAHPNLSPTQRTDVKAWLALAQSICIILETEVEVTYEAGQ